MPLPCGSYRLRRKILLLTICFLEVLIKELRRFLRTAATLALSFSSSQYHRNIGKPTEIIQKLSNPI